jgi:hypothetical protein
MRNKIVLGILALVLVVAAMFVVSARTVSITNQQSYSPNFQTYYTSAELESYWPVLKDFDPEKCEARQDLLLNVAPFGCKPGVVRSDLLADQNVPVFCQIDALKINPLIDIREIRNIRFTSKDYPPEVIGTGFHPARAALKTRDKLLGSPLINNIGYVVVVLKRNPNESALPDSVEVSLSAQVDYDSGNALGIGKVEFVLIVSGEIILLGLRMLTLKGLWFLYTEGSVRFRA